MQYSLGNMLKGGGALNPDGLALDLAFALDKTLTSRKGPTPTFTRSSTATFVGSNGLIQSAAINVPRFDHDPATGVCKGLLIEDTRTNLSTYSGAIVSGIGWFTNGVATSVSSTGANGSSSYSIIESATDSTHFVSNTGGTTATGATSIVSETNYTGSIFVKKVAGSADWVQLTLGSGGFGTSQYANFNIGNGTVGNSAGLASGIPPRIEEFPDGWYRCSITVKANATVANSAGVILALINNTDGTTRIPTYLGNASNSVLASLCQLEAGAFPLSYIPTTSGTAARSADVCSIIGNDFSSFYNQSEGTFVCRYAYIKAPSALLQNRRVISGGSQHRVIHGYTVGVDEKSVWYYDGTNNAVMVSAGESAAVGVVIEPNIIHAVSGPIIGPDKPHNGNLLTSMTYISFFENTSGHIARIQYFRKRLSNAKLQTLTAP